MTILVPNIDEANAMDTISGRLVSGYYRARSSQYPILNLVMRISHNDKRVIQIESPLRPYFVCTEEHLEQSIAKAKKIEDDILIEPVDWNHATKDGKLYKVSMWNPKHVGHINKSLDRVLDEADIVYLRRILIDLGIGIKVSIDDEKINEYNGDVPYPRILYIDLECDERWKIKTDIDFKKSRILTIGTVDDEGNKKNFNLKSEYQMILNFAAYAKDYDLLVYYAWDRFDEDLLRERSRRNNVPFDWRQVRFVNMYWLHKKMTTRIQRGEVGSEERGEQFSWSLEYIIDQEGLDVEKIKVPRNKFYECWLNNPEILELRGFNDALALKLLEDKHRHIQHHVRVADLCGLFVDESTFDMPVVDALILRASNKENPRLVWASRQFGGEQKRYKGAVVYEPKPKIHKNVLDLDLTSLYNRIIQTWEISPEVYKLYMRDREEFDLEGFLQFSVNNAKQNGYPLFPRILNDLEKERNYYKKLKAENANNRELFEHYDAIQYSYKVILLIFYGITGNSSARMYIRDVARSTSYMGRKISLKTKERFESLYVKEITYGDTDSIHLGFPHIQNVEQLVEVGHALAKDLNSFYHDWLGEEYGIPEEDRKIEIEFGKVYRRLLFVEAKKKYGYHKTWDVNKGFCDETGVVGFESIKANYCQFAKRLQREITEMVVRDREEEALSYFKKSKKVLFNKEYDPSELVLSVGLRKKVDEYKANTMHVRAAKKLLKLTGALTDDGRIRFVITKGGSSKPTVEPVVEGKIPEIGPTGLSYYWKKQISPASLRVLKAAGFSDLEIRGRTTLDNF